MYPEIELMGKTLHVYDLVNDLGVVFFLVFSILQSKKLLDVNLFVNEKSFMNQTKKKKILRFLFASNIIQAVILVAFFIFLMLQLSHAFAYLFTNSVANYYGTLTAWLITVPVFSIIFCYSPLYLFDLFTPGLPLFLFITKFACFFEGCCYGYEANTFYYNHITERYEIPVQLVEAGVALILFVFLIIFRKKTKRIGIIFPIYLITYSVSRFLTEFLRDDFPNIAGPFNAYQILSVVFAVIGVILLIIIFYSKEKIIAFFETKNNALMLKISHYETIKKKRSKKK